MDFSGWVIEYSGKWEPYCSNNQLETDGGSTWQGPVSHSDSGSHHQLPLPRSTWISLEPKSHHFHSQIWSSKVTFWVSIITVSTQKINVQFCVNFTSLLFPASVYPLNTSAVWAPGCLSGEMVDRRSGSGLDNFHWIRTCTEDRK